MIKKKPYKYLVSIVVTLLFFTNYSNGQLLDSIAFDTVPIYTLKQALKEDPLKVFKLRIKGQKLKAIPEDVYQFKNLNALDVSKNKLSEFPKRIHEFQYLQDLDISGNKIEIVTKELGLLYHLRIFKANQNNIVSIPAEIKYLKNLYYMDLWGNDLGSLPHEISELSESLKEIDMRVILMSKNEHDKIKSLLPNTKIKFSKACNCGF